MRANKVRIQNADNEMQEFRAEMKEKSISFIHSLQSGYLQFIYLSDGRCVKVDGMKNQDALYSLREKLGANKKKIGLREWQTTVFYLTSNEWEIGLKQIVDEIQAGIDIMER